MAHHVTERFPTHPITECGATVRLSGEGPDEKGYWFHMCGEDADHVDVHMCAECGVRFL